MICILLLTTVLAVLIWYTCIWPLNHFTRMGVKQTKPWPLFGDQWMTLFRRKSPAEMVIHIYNLSPVSRYFGFYQLTMPTLLLRDPELIKQITVKDFDHFTDHKSFVDPESDPLWGGNLFTLRDQKWREMRATLTGSFTSSKMKHMFNIINEAAENFVQHFLDKNEELIELEVKDAFTRYTNDVIATSAFGIKVDSLAEPNNDFYIMGTKIANFGGFVTILKVFGFFLVPKIFKLFKVSLFEKQVSSFFKNIIYETIEVREQKGIVRQDMINLLLEYKNGIKNEDADADVRETGFATAKETTNHLDQHKFKTRKQLTNDEITSQAFIFFLAGFDTVSTALCFGSYELAIKTEIQDKLRKEIMDTHKYTNGKLTYDALLKIKYLDMVFSEILRKWPPFVAMDRVCTKPYTIEPANADEKPVHLKVGDMLWLPMHGLHRDAKYYADPEKFDPERFSDENKDSIVPYTFIPFGSGPRNCIGSRFAILESKALLYHLLLNFEIVPTKNTAVPLKLDRNSMQNTSEGGFWLAFKRVPK